jgi:hypothetical protein
MTARYVRCDFLRVGDRIMNNGMSAVVISTTPQAAEYRQYIHISIRYDDNAGTQLIKTFKRTPALLVAEAE